MPPPPRRKGTGSSMVAMAGMACALMFLLKVTFFSGRRGPMGGMGSVMESEGGAADEKMEAWKKDYEAKWRRQEWAGSVARARSSCSFMCDNSAVSMDNTICPPMEPTEVSQISSHLRPESRVLQFGGAVSSLYFAQCVGEWTIIEHDPTRCAHISDLKPPNTHVYCFPQQVAASGEGQGSMQGYANAVSVLGKECSGSCSGKDKQCGCVDLVVVDGPVAAECAIKAVPYLSTEAVVFVRGWGSKLLGKEDQNRVLEHYRVLGEYASVPEEGAMVKLMARRGASRSASNKASGVAAATRSAEESNTSDKKEASAGVKPPAAVEAPAEPSSPNEAPYTGAFDPSRLAREGASPPAPKPVVKPPVQTATTPAKERTHGANQGAKQQGGAAGKALSVAANVLQPPKETGKGRLPDIVNDLYDMTKKPKTMEEWLNDEVSADWRHKRRMDILTVPEADQFGPPDSYPCKSQCTNGASQIETTLCPMMFPPEQKTMLEYLKPTSRVFEWGSGASTIYYSQCVKSWTSIEHDVGWCKQMQRMVPPNTQVLCVPIEPEFKESFGSPGTWDGSRKEFTTYVEAAHMLQECPDCIDIVIVDGRARGDCALEVLPYLREDSVLFIHDYLPERIGGRDNYGKALAAYDVIEILKTNPSKAWRMGGGLAILKPKKEMLEHVKKVMA